MNATGTQRSRYIPRGNYSLTLVAAAGIAVVLWVIPRWIQQKEKARHAESKVRVISAARAVQAYHKDFGAWPPSLDVLLGESIGVMYLEVPNGETKPLDGWGRPLLYKPFDPAIGHGSVESLGADGDPGGEDVNEDFSVRFPLESASPMG